MMQVENESGYSLGSVRDFPPAPQKHLDAAVPPHIASALHKPTGTWSQVFGADADEARAPLIPRPTLHRPGRRRPAKRKMPLPMYVNNRPQESPRLPRHHRSPATTTLRALADPPTTCSTCGRQAVTLHRRHPRPRHLRRQHRRLQRRDARISSRRQPALYSRDQRLRLVPRRHRQRAQ